MRTLNENETFIFRSVEETKEEKQKRESENRRATSLCRLPPYFAYVAVRTRKQKKGNRKQKEAEYIKEFLTKQG